MNRQKMNVMSHVKLAIDSLVSEDDSSLCDQHKLFRHSRLVNGQISATIIVENTRHFIPLELFE